MSSSLFDSPLRNEFVTRHWTSKEQEVTGTSTVKNDANQFQIILDVSQFKREEVEVKTVDFDVIIHAKHEEREDEHGFVSREFTRKYILPLGVDPMKITAQFDSKGILAIKAVKEVTEKTGKETLIKVEKEPESDTKVSSEGEKDPCMSRKEPREEFFKSEVSSKDLFGTKKPAEECFKGTSDQGKRFYESKSTFSSSSSSIHKTSVVSNEKLTPTRTKQFVTDV